jgi:beta-lactam-binding protein with PASTA domain
MTARELDVELSVSSDWSNEPDGIVIEQSPLPGTVLDPDEPISVLVSKGSP